MKTALAEHGLDQKVIPDKAQLAETYQQMCGVHRLNALVAQAVEESRKSQQTFPVPKRLTEDIGRLLIEHPTWSWDRAVSELASRRWNDRSRKRRRR